MEFRLLGALEVRDGGRRVALGAGRQRAVLAILLLHANQVVASDRLVDELWAGRPPGNARKALQVYVFRLRRTLGAERIRTRPSGYLLEVGPDELDVHRFERLVLEARALRAGGEATRAAAALREALGLWDGPALADFTYQQFAQNEIARLEELRLVALEERIDADLRAGEGANLVGELEALIAEHPYRERLRGQTMLALYRAGRQAEALAAYQQTRALLVDELGIEPSPALQRLEVAILHQEPELEPPPPVEPQPRLKGLDTPVIEVVPEAGLPPLPELAAQRRPRVSPQTMVLGAVAGIGVVAVLIALLISRVLGEDFLPRVDANSVGVIDADAPGIAAQLDLGGTPKAIAAGGGFVWVASEAEGTVSRIDPQTRAVQTLSLGGSATGVAYGGGSLWVTKPDQRSVAQIDPDALKVVQTFPVGNGPASVAWGAGAVWVANTIDGTVSRLDLRRGAVTKPPIPVAAHPAGIAVGAGAVWVASEESGTVLSLDPRSGKVAEAVEVGNGPAAIAVGEGDVWVANRQDGTVSRIDTTTDSVSATIPVGASPASVAVGGGGAWVANEGDGTIAHIDPDSRRVDETLSLESSPGAIALSGGNLWVATLPSLPSHRGGVLRVESAPSECRCTDPAYLSILVNLTDQNVITLSYDGLVAYRRVSGIAANVLVGDLAVRVPAPTDAGRTYTFQLRPDLRYSNGAPVRASDFRYSLERVLTVNRDFALHFYKGIRGAARCSAHPPERCDLSRGIEVDDGAATITIHLTEADPDFPGKLTSLLASVVPAGTPLRVASKRPIPGTGPYRVARFEPARAVRLVRNPYFRLWSQDARPDGYPDVIRFHLSDDAEAGLVAVEKGRADWVNVGTSVLSAARMQGVLTRHPRQLHSDPYPFSYWMFLNTRVPPFDDVRVRRALNYARDWNAIRRFGGSTLRSHNSCQILTPGLPGYRPYCPYTLNSNPAGTWIGPDPARARALIAASDTRGMRVEVATFESDRPAPLKLARYWVALLRKLGYRSSLRVLPDFGAYVAYIADSRNRAQLGPYGYVADILAPAFLLRLFSCEAFLPGTPANENPSEFCDRRIDRQMRRAAALQASDPARANELWADVDRALTDRAVAVFTSSMRNVVFVSERVGNYQSHPQSGTLLDQLWVK